MTAPILLQPSEADTKISQMDTSPQSEADATTDRAATFPLSPVAAESSNPTAIPRAAKTLLYSAGREIQQARYIPQ
jgi:hypothetical protein